jgi:GAF domain-containing protein
MPIWTRDKRTFHRRFDDSAAQEAAAPAPARVKAMAAASHIFAAAPDANALPKLAATALADTPGQMCLVSLAGQGDESLRPVAIAHARPNAARNLHPVLAQDPHTPADAFSCEVFRSGRALRMQIGRPRILRLWLPDVYWPHVERVGVSGVLAAALRHRGRVVGALLLWRERDQPAFDASDQAYVVSLAERLAFGLATHQLVA